MGTKHLRLTPGRVRKNRGSNTRTNDWWFYEGRTGIEVHHSPDSRHAVAMISVAALRSFLARLDREESHDAD